MKTIKGKYIREFSTGINKSNRSTIDYSLFRFSKRLEKYTYYHLMTKFPTSDLKKALVHQYKSKNSACCHGGCRLKIYYGNVCLLHYIKPEVYNDEGCLHIPG